jgi:hypothetical protein
MNVPTNPTLKDQQRTILVVVVTFALMVLINTIALSYCLVAGKTPDQVLLTAYMSLTTGAIGMLGGMLINPRASLNNAPSSVTVDNTAANPVIVEDKKDGQQEEIK